MPWPAPGKVSVQPQQLPASLAPPAWSLCCCGVRTPCPALRALELALLWGEHTLPCIRMEPVLGLSGRQGRRCCSQHPSCPAAFPAGWAVARGCGKARTGYAGSHSSLRQGCWRQAGKGWQSPAEQPLTQTRRFICPVGLLASSAVLPTLSSRPESSSPLADKNYEAHLSQFPSPNHFSAL